MKVTSAVIDNCTTKNGIFQVPYNVVTAIEACLVNKDANAITNEYNRLLLEFQSFEKLMIPAKVNYYGNGELTLDAYTSFYLPRYMSIPSIALRDLSRHPLYQDYVSPISILDVGSGTGAITIGLLSLFSSSPLSRIAINIDTIDCCDEALNRQKWLVEKTGYDSSRIRHFSCNLNACNDAFDSIGIKGPYHFIFIANCFTELEVSVARRVIEYLSTMLDSNGAIIIAEAQRDYIKKLIGYLAKESHNVGLHIYYPCTSVSCPESWCWVWRNHKYKLPSIKINSRPLPIQPKSQFPLSWLILTRQQTSIYDVLTAKHPHLLWGPIEEEHGDMRAICYGTRKLPFRMNPSLSANFDRGSIVGLSSEKEIIQYFKM